MLIAESYKKKKKSEIYVIQRSLMPPRFVELSVPIKENDHVFVC
jgi:hypothetical protein